MKKVIAAGLILAGFVAIGAMYMFIAPRGGSSPLVGQAEAFVVEPSVDFESNFNSVLGARSIPALATQEPDVQTLSPEATSELTPETTIPGQTPQVSAADSPGAIIVAVQPPPEDGASTGNEQQEIQNVIVPTYSWVNAFSDSSTLDGEPLPVGSVVTAYDPDGTLIGRYEVKRPGEYGAMPLYMDDPATPLDEGASSGDQIRFNINGLSAVVLGPSEPIWVENGAALLLNIAGGSLVIN